MTKRLQNEALKCSLAASSSFVLVEWCSLLLQHLRNTPNVPSTIVLDVISADAKLLETCLGGATRNTVRAEVLRIARRSLRAAFSSDDWGEEAIRASVIRLIDDPLVAQKNAPFLGVISGVCARLPDRIHVLEDLKIKILSFYVRELLGSRTVVPAHIADGLSDFFLSFVTHEDLKQEVLPALEKSILRSPEIVLGGLILSLCSSLPRDIDLSEMVHSRLVKPLLSSFKSTNPDIRHGAAQSFESLLGRCSSEIWLSKIGDEVVGPLKTQKITNAEHRALYAQVLSAIPCFVNLSQEITVGLVTVLSRESSEVALEPEINSFCKHLAHLIRANVVLNSEILNVIAKGSGDKRISFRKSWQLKVGNILWDCDPETLSSSSNQSLFKQFFQKLRDSFNEVISNALPSAQSGLVSVAYLFIALLGRVPSSRQANNSTFPDWVTTIAQSMSLTPKPSFLLNPRVYTKLTSQVDVLWKTRALSAIAKNYNIRKYDSATKDAWGQAFIYVIAGPGVASKFREEGAKALSEVYLNDAEDIGSIMVNALWSWNLSLSNADKEAAAAAAGSGSEKFLHLVVKAVCPRPSEWPKERSDIEGIIRSQLIEMLVLCRTELIPNLSWIDLCLRTGIDPGKLVSEHSSDSMKQLTRVMEVCSPGSYFIAITYIQQPNSL